VIAISRKANIDHGERGHRPVMSSIGISFGQTIGMSASGVEGS
jgi:hypothetical protein